ncbi:hypothetical protein M8J77_013975 [Diaphorina citri]|nr:hypothetical protein M8J77_013975 [Diaphorina citri]
MRIKFHTSAGIEPTPSCLPGERLDHYATEAVCNSTSKSTPDKVFISVPRDENRRKAWFNAMRRKNVLSSKTFAAVCADHFDLENDIENNYCYHDYQNLDIECSIHSKIVCNSESYRKIYVGDY